MIQSLFRVILYVQDMNMMQQFYRDTLELWVIAPAGFDDYSNEFWVQFDTDGCIPIVHSGSEMRLGSDTLNPNS